MTVYPYVAPLPVNFLYNGYGTLQYSSLSSRLPDWAEETVLYKLDQHEWVLAQKKQEKVITPALISHIVRDYGICMEGDCEPVPSVQFRYRELRSVSLEGDQSPVASVNMTYPWDVLEMRYITRGCPPIFRTYDHFQIAIDRHDKIRTRKYMAAWLKNLGMRLR